MTTNKQPQSPPILPDEGIIQSAIIKGFVISTQYGQEAGKLMPISDTKTLIAFARDIERLCRSDLVQAPIVEGLDEALTIEAIYDGGDLIRWDQKADDFEKRYGLYPSDLIKQAARRYLALSGTGEKGKGSL